MRILKVPIPTVFFFCCPGRGSVFQYLPIYKLSRCTTDDPVGYVFILAF
jgi:hypothetical protein